jgi:predicted SnoaL-like aldol condensation-catalyzing enzyme
VRAFVAELLEGGAHDAVDGYLSADLIEHDPQSCYGSDAFVARLQTRNVTYRHVHHVIGDGNFVFVLSEGTIDATEVAHYDLFRVEGSRIVEHWNGRRNVPASTQSGLGIF